MSTLSTAQTPDRGTTLDGSAASKKGPSRGRLGRLLSFYKPHWVALTCGILLAFLVNLAVIAKPWILKQVIDGYITTGRASDIMVIVFGVVYFLVVLTGACASYVQTVLMTRTGVRIMHTIRTTLFDHVLHLNLGFFDRNSSGRILTRVTTDVEALSDLYAGVLVTMVRDAVLVVGIVVAMFLMDAQLALVSICCVPVIGGATVIYRWAARRNFIKVKATVARINGFLAENIAGMKLVQIFHREREKYSELAKLDREYYHYGLREIILNSFSRPLIDVINNLTISILVVFCFDRVHMGLVQIGTVYAFITYIRSFFEPISTLAEQYTSLQSAGVSADRIFELADTKAPLEDLEAGLPLPSAIGDVEFRNVWFAYNEERWVLKDVSFHVASGQTAAFVGSTGSGKSTIISLLARYYEIQKGVILLDGVDIRNYRLSDLRRRVSVVIQDVFLFSGDIRSNIRLGDASISDAQIRKAATLVKADRFIEQLPGGWDALVHERGSTFSAGQRQLLSFARAIAADPAVLVLDEATANIDTETEADIQEAMANIRKNRTMLVVAHRLSTVRDADLIVVIEHGVIQETGRHDELVERGGVYARLVSAQMRG